MAGIGSHNDRADWHPAGRLDGPIKALSGSDQQEVSLACIVQEGAFVKPTMDGWDADAALLFGTRYANDTKIEWRENGRELTVRRNIAICELRLRIFDRFASL
jgi:hypothetical protein